MKYRVRHPNGHFSHHDRWHLAVHAARRYGGCVLAGDAHPSSFQARDPAPEGRHSRRPKHRVMTYHDDLLEFLESKLPPDDFAYVENILRADEEREQDETYYPGEDGEEDTPHQEKDWEDEYPARDTPPPLRGRPAPGGTTTGEDARHARRFSQPSRRGRAMDHVPRSLFFGPPTPGDVQMEAYRKRAADVRLRLNMRRLPEERVAMDSRQARGAASFEKMFPEAGRIGFAP
jgi:hypothetical protein